MIEAAKIAKKGSKYGTVGFVVLLPVGGMVIRDPFTNG